MPARAVGSAEGHLQKPARPAPRWGAVSRLPLAGRTFQKARGRFLCPEVAGSAPHRGPQTLPRDSSTQGPWTALDTLPHAVLKTGRFSQNVGKYRGFLLRKFSNR